jgi:hypothetical protein
MRYTGENTVVSRPWYVLILCSIASAFIKSCPSTNMALPVMAYPALTLISGQPTAPGALIDLKPKTMPTGDYFATFVSGLDIITVKTQGIKNDMIMVEVPTMASGQSYVFITSDMSGNLTDSNILAGKLTMQLICKCMLTFNRTCHH